MSFNNVLRNAAGPMEIILFDFLECDRQLPCVNRAMRDACEKATTTRLRPTIEMRDPRFVSNTRAEAERICAGRPLETALAELMQGLSGRFVQARSWEHIVEMYRAYAQQNPEARDEAFGQRLLVCLHTIGSRYDSLDILNTFLAQERLAKRAREVLPELHGQLQPEQLHTFLYALQMDQDRLNLTVARRQQLDAEAQRPDCFSRRVCVQRELIGLLAEPEEDQELCRLWSENLRWHLPQGPAAGASAREIREWIRDPEHAHDLAQLEWVRLGSMSVVPREIGALTGLRWLSFTEDEAHNFRLIGLPEELGDLQNLEGLWFENCTSFREIPPLLEGLPALYKFSIVGNDRPIRVFPSWLDNKINSGFCRGIDLAFRNVDVQTARMDQFFGLQITSLRPSYQEYVNREWNVQYAGLPHEEFTDIPFNIWFRENVCIPHFGFYMIEGLIEFVNRLSEIPEFFKQGWLELIQALTFPLIPTFAFIGFVGGLGALLTLGMPWFIFEAAMITFEITATAPLLNPIIHNTIGRLAEAIYVAYQESIGAEDPHMIHVRDFPAPQPVAAEAPAALA